MKPNADVKRRLVDVNDSVLIIIDIQDSFLSKYDRAATQAMVAKNVWLIQVARHLNVPIIAMAEDIANAGNLNQEIQAVLPKSGKIHSKDAFSLVDNPAIFADVKDSGRKTAILVGMETDVCVAQSALGLLENDYQVVAVQDAMLTTAADEIIGLQRMVEAGASICSVKSIYYEWIRSVSKAESLDVEAPHLRTSRPSVLVM